MSSKESVENNILLFKRYLVQFIYCISYLALSCNSAHENHETLPMILIENLHKSYQTGSNWLHVLKGIDLHIKEGEFVSVMGSSGSGKSTLLNILGILDDYDDGRYLLDNILMSDALSQNEAAHYRNRMLGFVFQSFNLLSFKNAVDNVALPLFYQKIERKERTEIAREFLDRVGLLPWADHYPNQLSGGQQQRVAIARALVTKPKVILADEPTGALDSVTSNEVIQLFKEFNEEGMTVVIVTHESEVSKLTSRIIRIRDGVIENPVHV